MARQQPPTGETKTPVIVALVFFVLLSLTLGVLTYLAYDEKAKLTAQAAESAKKEQDAQKLRGQDQERVLFYKTLLGTNTQEEFDNLKNAKNKDTVKAEYAAAMDAIGKRIQGLTTQQAKNFIGTKFEIAPTSVVQWSWGATDAPDKQPETPLLGALVASLAQAQLAKLELSAQMSNLDEQKKAYIDSRTKADAATADFKAKTGQIPAQIAAETAKAKAAAQERATGFETLTNAYVADTRKQKDEVSYKDIQIAQLQEKVKNLQTQLGRLEGQLELKEDPFAFDKPHGKVIRRRGNIVDIDLGSADNVRPGLTFSVQPSDTPERGLQSRMRPKMGPNGRPVTDHDRPVMEVVSKGTIEVIEVLGPNLSQARITSQSDQVRDAILVGDLLYNAAWRKGAADHVALFGVFDVDGDGTDDIKTVVRDLSKMGVVVDAYFDLEQKKWVGRLTEQTIYAVEGYYPAFTGGGGDALASAKSQLDQALLDARNQAKERGAKVVKFRDFFPRIGYRVRLDVTPDTINRAFNKYLTTLPTQAEPNKDGM